jgi:hypothetical protein
MYKNIFTKEILDRYDFPDLSDSEWQAVCKELDGRIDNFLDEKLDNIIEDVCEDLSKHPEDHTN